MSMLDGLPGIAYGHNINIQKGTVIGAHPLKTGFDENGNRVRTERKTFPHIILGNNIDIGANCVINHGYDQPTIIEDDVWIGHNSVIGHGARIMKGSVIGIGVILAGKVIIEPYCYISSGTIIQPCINIGRGTMVGSGSNVTKDIGKYRIAYGNPCNFVGWNEWRHPQDDEK